MTGMNLEQLLHRMGGVAARRALVELTSRAEVDRALRERRLVRVSRGRYGLPGADEGRRAAAALHGVASHRSAAAYWGWEMKVPPDKPCITVDRDRTLTKKQQSLVTPRWRRLPPEDVVDGWVTSPGRTFVDCCRDLPFGEALVIGDSALRSRRLSEAQMLHLAERMRGPGRTRCLRVAEEATDRAENPFESVLRAITLGVPGLVARPQVLVLEKPFTVRPDLVDERLWLALEADSFAWHGSREALRRDCRRYNLLTVHGWRVLRFSWEDVMLDPQHVSAILKAAVAAVHPHA
jgi:very-short-patch-repair endonuclease